MKKHFTATALIIQNNKVLLLKHKKLESWLPPGGHLEENESAHEGAIREVKEETGFDIKIISSREKIMQGDEMAFEIPRPLFCLEEFIPKHKEVAEHKHLDFVFLAEIVSGELLENPEEELCWFTKEEIINMPKEELFENVRQICLEILK